MAHVNTVLGPISTEKLGFTLMHEHVKAAIQTMTVENPRRFFEGK